jgi:hypothetical protein
MTEYSWRNLAYDEEADIHLLDYFCKRGASDKDPAKPGKPALFGFLPKVHGCLGRPRHQEDRGGDSNLLQRPWDGRPCHAGCGSCQPARVQRSAGDKQRPKGCVQRVLAADSLAEDALAGGAGEREASQDGVEEVDQDCAGEDPGCGAGG